MLCVGWRIRVRSFDRFFSAVVSMADLRVARMLESSLTTVSSGSALRCAFKSAHINQCRKRSNEVFI